MESHRYRARAVFVAVAAAASLLLSLAPSQARERTDTRAGADDSGVTIEFRRSGDELTGSVPGRGGGAIPTDPDGEPCQFTAKEYSDSFGGTTYGRAPSPEHRLYQIFCNGFYWATRWVGPSDRGEVSRRGVAEEVIRRLAVGDVTIGARPATGGITGIPSLFWIDGWDGRAVEHRVTELGVTVDVRLELTGVVWDFGDGSEPLTAGTGEAWPERSSVRHTYVHRSPAGDPYDVSATITMAASFREPGAPWQGLGPIVRHATLAYEVDEIQAVRDR